MMRTTNKEVVQKLREHILEYFSQDFGWDTDNRIDNLKEQVSAMQWSGESDYATGVRIAEGGTMLVYYDETKDFLNSLGINPENKEYRDSESWSLYLHLVGREISNLVK
jgi:hypothetical protein